MKIKLGIISLLFIPFCNGQSKDSVENVNQQKNINPLKPEILKGGFIDIVQNGQMNASARLFRLYIGEPGKFQIPISLYTGVSANNFSYIRQNEEFILNLINPGTGIFNLSFDGTNKIIGNKEKITSLQIQYQAGLRFLTVYDKNLQKNITFCNGISGLGLTLVTGAWERNRLNKMGIFWLNLRSIFSKNPSTILSDYLAVQISSHLYGYSIGMGIEISQALNVKIFYFSFLNNRQIPAFTQPFFQLSFNYSIE